MNNIIEKIQQCFSKIPEKDRRANIGPLNFLATLVLCFARDTNKRSLGSLRRDLIAKTGQKISRSTFWKRMTTKRLFNNLNYLVGQLMQETSLKLNISQTLLSCIGVCAIYLLDSSSSTLPKDAQNDFPAPRKNVIPSSIKWHCLWDLLGGKLKWHELSAAREHDRKHFPPLEMLRGALIIMDLGYFDFQLMAEIAASGGYFLCRLKSNTQVEVVKVIEGISEKFEGHLLLKSKLPRGCRIIEVAGAFGSQGKILLLERVIGFWNPHEKTYHWYVTNLEVRPELIYTLYRLRWQIELVFKAAKSSLRLSDISTADRSIILNLHFLTLSASLLTTSVALAMTLKLDVDQKPAITPQRSAMLMVHLASSLRKVIVEATEVAWKNLRKKLIVLAEELFDPNFKNRETSLMRAINLAENLS